MSDYIFSSARQEPGFLSNIIKEIYRSSTPEVCEIHGGWGSLAVSVNHYNGFLPYENERHLLVAIGGPVVCFRNNDYLTEGDSNQATEAIYNRWVEDKTIVWDEDLSGPFTFLLLDKEEEKVEVVTDLMSFIPVYCYQGNSQLFLGTHIDALAKACQKETEFDEVSLADFALNDVVTFPYTAYRHITQLYPSSITEIAPAYRHQNQYWSPKEEQVFPNINEAAAYLRNGIAEFVNKVTDNMSEIAHFISAGEDSRSLAGLMPKKIKRDAFVFLDQMNREGEIARKVAAVYGADINIGFRSASHYLDILPEATDLVGSGHQYTHAHSLGFDKKFKLAHYTAVFGGFLSDTLLKGHHVKLFRGYERISFMPQIKSKDQSPIGYRFNNLKQCMKHVDEIRCRQEEHLEYIKRLRKESAEEWFNYYPASMHNDFPNLYSTRRLFKSYEPFMCKEAVKTSAGVPTSWKLNRRLFNIAMKPYLKPSKWLLHADGRLPYFSWKVNIPIQSSIWFYRQVAKRIGVIKGNQGPWGDWKALFNDPEWERTVIKYADRNPQLAALISYRPLEDILLGTVATTSQKTNIIQLLHGAGAKHEAI